MPSEKLANGIKEAVGVHSVYLAAKHDENLAGRFSHTDGRSLVDGESKATKRSIANVMVYMAGKYRQQLTSEEVEMGLLAAAPSAASTKKRQKPGPNFDDIGKQYADKLSGVLTANEIGVEIKTIIDRFEMYDPTSGSYRTLEQALGVAMRMLGWDRRRQMTGGTRAYRWYPPEGFFDGERAEPGEPEDVVLDANGVDEVFDDDWSDDIADEAVVVAVVEEVVEAEPAPVEKRKRSGVKPDADLLARIQTMNLYPGISSYEVALDSYDFVGNGLKVPKTDEGMTHKVKLSIGATMKSMGWVKRTRRVDSVPRVGWHPPKDWEDPTAVEGVIRRAPEPEVDEPEPKDLGSQLPKLSDQAEAQDDLPWPDESDFSGDAGEEGSEVRDPQSWTRAYVKMVNADDGTEEVVEGVILMKHAGTYLMGTADNPRERMLEWNAEEEIWVCTVGSAEE